MRQLFAAALVAGVVSGSAALAADDPDWPCVQRLVPQISAAQVWTGPPPEPRMWAGDLDVARLASKIAARRTPLEEATKLVDTFARGLDSESRADRLTALFGRSLQLINADRASLIAGIKRFARKQASLAERIRDTRVASSAADLPPAQRDELAETLTWDLRIFEDREKSQIYLCEQPVLLEQRAFALGRAIGAHLEE